MPDEIKKVGFIMPISTMESYSDKHWKYVRGLLAEIVVEEGLGDAKIVSYDEIEPDIKRRIINHIYNIPIVICDVSGNNPNVLYELGLRVAFDMPIIIIKDEKTKFNFDLNSFDHVIYPNDIDSLPKEDEIVKEFIDTLKSRLNKTWKAFNSNSSLISPLKNYLEYDNYLKVRRGVSFNLEGHYEYKCFKADTGYGHGGICHIRPVNSVGNLIEWQLIGNRCWIKPDKDHTLELYEHPYRWETKNAVLFPNKSFIVSYNIITDESNICGFINGDFKTDSNDHVVQSFMGRYYQDDGKNFIKGRFEMVRIPVEMPDKGYEFILTPGADSSKYIL